MTASEARKQTAGEQLFDGRFILGDVIGRGRQSIVYRAEQLRPPTPLQRIVALKLIYGSNKDPDGVFRRVRREALGMLASRSEHTTRLYDYVTSGEQPYLVMEYAERGDLKAYATRQGGSLDFHEAVDLTIQTLHGLAAVHRAGMIHRDIKAENLLLTSLRNVKIADFSIAWVPNEYLTLEKANPVVGTFDYLAPESLNDGICNIKSDLYSIGMTLYELITGIYPFGDGPFSEQVSRKLAGSWTPLTELINPVPPFLPELFKVALASDPAERFGTADDFIKALESLRNGTWQPPVKLTGQIRIPSPEQVLQEAAAANVEDSERTAPSLFAMVALLFLLFGLGACAYLYRDTVLKLFPGTSGSAPFTRETAEEPSPPNVPQEPPAASNVDTEAEPSTQPAIAQPPFRPTYSLRLAQYPGLSASALIFVDADEPVTPRKLIVQIHDERFSVPLQPIAGTRDFVASFPTPEKDFRLFVVAERNGDELVSDPLLVDIDCHALSPGEGEDSTLSEHPLLAQAVKLAAQVDFLTSVEAIARLEPSARGTPPAQTVPARAKSSNAHRFSCLMANPTSKLLSLKTEDLQRLMELRANKVEILEKELSSIRTEENIAKLNARANKLGFTTANPVFSADMSQNQFTYRLALLGIVEDANRR